MCCPTSKKEGTTTVENTTNNSTLISTKCSNNTARRCTRHRGKLGGIDHHAESVGRAEEAFKELTTLFAGARPTFTPSPIWATNFSRKRTRTRTPRTHVPHPQTPPMILIVVSDTHFDVTFTFSPNSHLILTFLLVPPFPLARRRPHRCLFQHCGQTKVVHHAIGQWYQTKNQH